MKSIALFTLALAASNVSAATTLPANPSWAQLAKLDDPTSLQWSSWSFDQNSIVRKGDEVTYWERRIYEDPKHQLKLVTISRYTADCNGRKLTRTVSALSDKTGAVTPERVIEKVAVEPFDGRDGDVAKFVCTIGK